MFDDLDVEKQENKRFADTVVESADKAIGKAVLVRHSKITVWRVALPAIFLVGGVLGVMFLRTPAGEEYVPQPRAAAAPELTADLEVGASVLDKGPYVTGSAFEVVAPVRNVGRAQAGIFRTMFEIDWQANAFRNADKAVFGSPVEGLAAGSEVAVRSEPISVAASLTGNHAVRACVDVFGEVAESNEDNNCGPALVFEVK